MCIGIQEKIEQTNRQFASQMSHGLTVDYTKDHIDRMDIELFVATDKKYFFVVCNDRKLCVSDNEQDIHFAYSYYKHKLQNLLKQL